MAVQRVMVFDRLDNYLCDLSPKAVRGLSSVEEINGEHSLTVTLCGQTLEKTNRVVVRDKMGYWHEYVVLGVESERETPRGVVTEYYCVWSVQYDLAATFVDDPYGCGIVPGHASVPQTARKGLECSLEGTSRWQIGTVSVTTMAAASFYRRSGWEGIQTVIEKWGGEIDVTITVGINKVVSRAVNLLDHVGKATPTRRFDYGHDVASVRRIVSDDVWPCRIVPLGKASETEAGGYTRRPSIESVNGGVMWIQDDAVVPFTRVPDGSGGWEYPTAIVENDTYEEPAELLAWALEHIGDYTAPKVTYEAEVVQLAQAGMNPHGVALGDEVLVVDRTFYEDMGQSDGGGLVISARVVRQECNLLDPSDIKLTIGNAREKLSDQLAGLSRRVAEVASQVSSASAYQSTSSYVSNLLARINAETNALGGYYYFTEGQGIRCYDVAVTDPLVGAEASSVVEIKGGTIRIANTKTSSGDWEWKTLIVSGYVNAEVLRAIGASNGWHVEVDATGVYVRDPSNGVAAEFGADGSYVGYQDSTHTAMEPNGFSILHGPDKLYEVRYQDQLVGIYGGGTTAAEGSEHTNAYVESLMNRLDGGYTVDLETMKVLMPTGAESGMTVSESGVDGIYNVLDSNGKPFDSANYSNILYDSSDGTFHYDPKLFPAAEDLGAPIHEEMGGVVMDFSDGSATLAGDVGIEGDVSVLDGSIGLVNYEVEGTPTFSTDGQDLTVGLSSGTRMLFRQAGVKSAVDGSTLLFAIGTGVRQFQEKFAVLADGTISTLGNLVMRAANPTIRRYCTSLLAQIGQAVPESNTAMASQLDYDSGSNLAWYSQLMKTASDDLYRSLVLQRKDGRDATVQHGFYMHIGADGKPKLTFTANPNRPVKAAWHEAISGWTQLAQVTGGSPMSYDLSNYSEVMFTAICTHTGSSGAQAYTGSVVLPVSHLDESTPREVYLSGAYNGSGTSGRGFAVNATRKSAGGVAAWVDSTSRMSSTVWRVLAR